MKDARFEKIREGLYQELLNANMHFKTFWALFKAPVETARIRKVYITFFVLTMRSHNERFYIAVHNVIKPDKDTANFEKLFNYIKSNQKTLNILDLKEIEGMKSTIQSHETLIGKIASIRDQYIAHNQIKEKHLYEQPLYDYDEGKRLLIDLNNILEKVSIKYDGLSYWHDEENLLNAIPSLNVEDMLRHLTEYRSEQIKKRRQGVTS